MAVFSERFIRNPIMTILCMVTVLFLGIVSYFKLPVSDLPVVDYPVITVTAVYPGASPDTMASTVASPLENECMQIQGLQSIISNNVDSQTTITLTFDLNRNVDLAAPDVQAAISRAQANLPGDLPQPPSYEKTNPSEAPTIYISLTSDTLTAGDLYDFGNRTIGKRMSMLDGVSQVLIYGAKSAIRVQVNPDKMAAFKVGINEVANVLKAGTVTIPGGSLNGPDRTFSIQPQGQLFKAEEYDDLIVKYVDGAPVRIKDIGKSLDSLQNDNVNVMYSGEAGDPMESGVAVVAISRATGANTVALSASVRQTLEGLRDEIPGSVKVDVLYDKAEDIVESIDDVKTTIVIALILVVLVIFVFLGRINDTIIPGMVLPFTICVTFAVMLARDFSLDNLSLMALTLSVGFLVDDAIVILENTTRHIEMGKKPLRASIDSMSEITGAVISTSIALIIVFIPLVFMGGVVGRNFKEFALTVIIAITCSTVIALTLTPMMCSRMLKEMKDAKTSMQKFIDKYIGAVILRYTVMLKWLLLRRHLALVGWGLCMVGTMWFFSVLPKTFMPEGDSGAIQGGILMQQGTSTEQMRRFQDQINAVLRNNEFVEKVLTVTGTGTGADQSSGVIIAILKKGKRPTIQKITRGLMYELMGFPAGMVFLQPIPSLKLSTGGESTATGSRYSYIVKGEDADDVHAAASKLQDAMYKLPGFTGIQNNVKLNMPQLKVNILRDRASTLGLTAADIENALLLAYAGGKVTTYKTDVDQYYVILELDKEYKDKPEDLARIYVRSGVTGELVPLESVAEWEETIGPQNVPHSDQLNSATISFNLTDSMPVGTATDALQRTAAGILPEGVTGTFQGEAQEFEDSVKSLGVLLLLSVFLMYVVLGILYESYIHPFTVITTLPVATFGGLATLLVCRAELSLYAYIGMFMLLGIVSKNGILMVDFAKQRMEEGLNSFDAIYEACRDRFRPILMTGASTIIGAIPIALGFGADGSSRQPLGLIIVGGLAFAQVLTLFVTPGIFLYMQQFQEEFLDRFELSRSISKRKTMEKE
ncbi:MAG: efflux RND transporter permease subunit [Candidatus Omnitrophica bacterium]|nr:efflux RND transporter permease subunit [Candidatus Omnitrophota bacterium]MDD5488272.1 efflux RND transporter permease subunit [Candidatus Omnitrophota bacterium]